MRSTTQQNTLDTTKHKNTVNNNTIDNNTSHNNIITTTTTQHQLNTHNNFGKIVRWGYKYRSNLHVRFFNLENCKCFYVQNSRHTSSTRALSVYSERLPD